MAATNDFLSVFNFERGVVYWSLRRWFAFRLRQVPDLRSISLQICESIGDGQIG
jgi:hypothetical protein